MKEMLRVRTATQPRDFSLDFNLYHIARPDGTGKMDFFFLSGRKVDDASPFQQV